MLKPLSVLFICLLLTDAFAGSALQEVVNVEAVNVLATARDSRGKLVRDLRPEDFTIYENGIRQPILDVSYYAQDSKDALSGKDTPLSVAFVLDTSDSMASAHNGERRIDMARHAMSMLMQELKKDDHAMLVSFTRYPRLLAKDSTDLAGMERVLRAQNPGGDRTAIYDSLSVVIDEMESQWGRKILILCTDGEDNSSKTRFTDFLKKLGSSDVIVLAFTIPAATVNGQYTISKMAEITGGHSFFPKTRKELQSILVNLRNAMRNQYSIWYRPSATAREGDWRSIQIECRRPGIEFNHRPGYFAR